jgi:hypothetical protein
MDQDQKKDSPQKSGENFSKAQHKNREDSVNKARKDGNAMGDSRFDSEGKPIDTDSSKTDLK